MNSTRTLWRAGSALTCLALLITPAQAAKTQAGAKAPAKTVAKTARNVYVVRKGDALVRIAKRLGVSARELARVNGLKDPDRIREGQVLRVPSPMATRGKSSSGVKSNDSLARTAMEYRGVPYRYAGMSTRGMDCSGLVARVLLTHGIKAPHNAAAMYKLGTAVSRGQLRSGDLVFFHTTRPGISHVGIYLGDGKFVHASSAGGRVQVDRLDQGYYHQRFVGARRLG
jgi:cell wall-associated NlpC family hydrolase